MSYKKFIFKLLAIIVPSAFIFTSLLISAYIKKSYQTTENELIHEETQFASFELAENLKRDVTSRVTYLQSAAQGRPDIFPLNKPYFEKITAIIFQNIPGFLAVNWIDPEGYIRWIYPVEPNINAKGKNVLEKENVKNYLEESKATKTPKISHVVDLFQGRKGLIIYVPIYDRGTFKGWYNGVIDIVDFLNKFFELRKLENIHVIMKWKGHDEYIYSHGESSAHTTKIELESQILNQTLIVQVDLNRDSILIHRSKNLENTFTFIYISIGIIAIFIFYLVRSQFAFMYLNRTLSRDKILLNILTHDMATPLTLISENIKRLKDKLKGTDYPEIERIARSSDKQKELLSRVRSFHAINMGKIQVELIPVSTMEIITETIAHFEQQLSEKEISCEVQSPDGIIYGCTDRVTAINNVMANVLGNAIKFSNSKSKIIIKTYKYKKYVVIETIDQGRGISDEILANIFEEDEITSTRGTQGEAGTGLGMLQIKSFMELYKGDVRIQTSESGTSVRLYFTATNLD
jgi:signal transduction histidine kinase